MKKIDIVLTRRRFDLIAAGKKTSEYRQVKLFWRVMFKDAKPGDEIVFHRGDTHVETVRRITAVSIVEGWQLPQAEREFFGPCNDVKFYKVDFSNE